MEVRTRINDFNDQSRNCIILGTHYARQTFPGPSPAGWDNDSVGSLHQTPVSTTSVHHKAARCTMELGSEAPRNRYASMHPCIHYTEIDNAKQCMMWRTRRSSCHACPPSENSASALHLLHNVATSRRMMQLLFVMYSPHRTFTWKKVPARDGDLDDLVDVICTTICTLRPARLSWLLTISRSPTPLTPPDPSDGALSGYAMRDAIVPIYCFSRAPPPTPVRHALMPRMTVVALAPYGFCMG